MLCGVAVIVAVGWLKLHPELSAKTEPMPEDRVYSAAAEPFGPLVLDSDQRGELEPPATNVITEITKHCERNGISRVQDLVGTLLNP
jgi:hypothetical protein